MRRVLVIFGLGYLLVGGLSAGVPECKTVKFDDGTTAESCTRTPDYEECVALAKEAWKSEGKKLGEDPPPANWHGCSWRAMVSTVRGGGTRADSGVLIPLYWLTSVTVIPSFWDSERMDITVTAEEPDGTYRKLVQKDRPITIRDKIPSANAEFISPHSPIGVPTVEAREKGGKKEASHSYK